MRELNLKEITMKINMLITITALVSISSFAGETENNNSANKMKKYDHKKYCYYADKEYSKGSILKQVNQLKVCTISSDGTLIWTDK